MVKSVQAKGKTVEEAIQNALEELGVTQDKVTTKVLDIPDSGIMSMFGNRYARVEVTVNDDTLERGKQFLTELLEQMGVKGTVNAYYEDEALMLDIDSKETGILIGRRGQTLDSIQYLTSLVVNRDRSDHIRVSLDVADYRQKRKNALQDLADRIALKVEKTKTKYELEPMNPYERRIIHSALQNYEHVTTHSEGEEPDRHIVIEYKR